MSKKKEQGVKNPELNKPSNGHIPQKAVDAILEKGVDFVVTIQKKTIANRLHLRANERQFTIYPITMGTLFKISQILLDMNVDGLTKAMTSEKTVNILNLGAINVVENKNKLIQMIAYGVINKEKEPSKKLIKFFNDNLTTKEALKLLTLIIQQMDISPFLASLVSMKGANLLETKKEIIPGESSED